jgi:FkbM family methyltransferase
MVIKYVLGTIWNHPSNRGRRLGTIFDALRWQAYKRLNKKPKVIDVYGGLKMRCYPNSRGASVMIYSSCWPDYDEMHFVTRYLREGDAVVDVGANIGIYTLLTASLVGKAGRVVAFEPGSKALPILRDNVSLNRLEQVEIREQVIGATDGEVAFLQDQDLTGRIAADVDVAGGSSPSMTRCITLDRVVQGPFALGKIDIEGAEPMAFEGGKQSLLDGNPPVWIMELKDRLLKKYGWTAERFAQVIRDLGYLLTVYDANSNELTIIGHDAADRENVIAIKESAMEHVKARLAERFPGK